MEFRLILRPLFITSCLASGLFTLAFLNANFTFLFVWNELRNLFSTPSIFVFDSIVESRPAAVPITAPPSTLSTATFATLWSHFEPNEFYSVRKSSFPKAPSLVRNIATFIVLSSSVIVFIYAVVTTSYQSSEETDIFRSLSQTNTSTWDHCSPITTLGSTYSPYIFTFLDDCTKRFRVHAYKSWYENPTQCAEHLEPSQEKLCKVFDHHPRMTQKTMDVWSPRWLEWHSIPATRLSASKHLLAMAIAFPQSQILRILQLGCVVRETSLWILLTQQDHY